MNKEIKKCWYCPVVHPLKVVKKEIFKNYTGNFQCKSIRSGIEIPFYNGKYYYH